ncbi:hypothetical protein H0H87_010013 [Tephrocybe sp. NHM501043]|nr:hypothetical protein H0H87_010013 [Tephrocybe sp. NHM501043]
MTAACKECGSHTEWNDEAGSNICIACGTLADPSQTILADPEYLSTTAVNTILKSLRTQGHALAGQSKESRDSRNRHAMDEYISSVAVSLNASGLTPRATVLFKQAMEAGSFRWGRKAKLVAGASLAIAFREYRRPDSLSDIAYLLDEQCSALTRMLSTLISLLHLSLTPVDPSIHITPLLTHLSTLLTTPQVPHPHPLPAPLVSQLKAITLRSAANTATSLCTLLARLGPDHPLNSLPSPPTAVAVFLLALEAECRSPLTQLGDLAQALGASCHKTSRSIVMARYKLVQDEICVWVEQVPWLTKYEQKTTNGKTRAKVGKRLIIARGIADVVQFQDEIWRGKLRPTVLLDMGDDKDNDEEFEVDASESNLTSVPEPRPLMAARPTKRQKISHHPLRDATQFLLNPLTGPLPDCESPPEPVTNHTHIRIPPNPSPAAATQPPPLELPPSSPPFQANAQHFNTRRAHPFRLQSTTSFLPPPPLPPTVAPSTPALSHTPTHPPPPSSQPSHPPPAKTLLPPPLKPTHSRPCPSLPAYILTAPSPSLLRSRAPPTRLQILAASRGTADDIDDEELFGEGEMEGFIRPPEEAMEVKKRLVGLGIFQDGDEEEGEEEGKKEKEKRKSGRKRKGKGERKGNGENFDEEDGGETRKSRVDLDALARFLDNPSCEDADADAEADVILDDNTAFLGLEHFSDKDEDDADSEDDDHRWSASAGAAAAVLWRGKMHGGGDERLQMGARAEENGGEVVLDGWRPLSPDGYGCGYGGYEEEYD